MSVPEWVERIGKSPRKYSLISEKQRSGSTLWRIDRGMIDAMRVIFRKSSAKLAGSQSVTLMPHFHFFFLHSSCHFLFFHRHFLEYIGLSQKYLPMNGDIFWKPMLRAIFLSMGSIDHSYKKIILFRKNECFVDSISSHVFHKQNSYECSEAQYLM